MAFTLFIAAEVCAIVGARDAFISLWALGTAVSCGGVFAGFAFRFQKATENAANAAKWGLRINATLLLGAAILFYPGPVFL